MATTTLPAPATTAAIPPTAAAAAASGAAETATTTRHHGRAAHPLAPITLKPAPAAHPAEPRERRATPATGLNIIHAAPAGARTERVLTSRPRSPTRRNADRAAEPPRRHGRAAGSVGAFIQ